MLRRCWFGKKCRWIEFFISTVKYLKSCMAPLKASLVALVVYAKVIVIVKESFSRMMKELVKSGNIESFLVGGGGREGLYFASVVF